MADDISQRKVDHLDLCAEEDVEYRGKTSLLEDVEFLHNSLPELAWDELDTRVEVMGKTLAAPLLITGMTGGATRAGEINRTLAAVAQDLGLAFGVGSQRAMLNHPELLTTYAVRDVAPDVLLFGNIGAVQAAEMTSAEADELVGAIDADALCIHLNPGQELIQPEGDRDFRGCLAGIERLTAELSIPVIVKETGSGLSAQTLELLVGAGVAWVDTSGAGGTTWIGVEALRAPAHERPVGELFWDWGVPTAPSIVWAKERGFNVIGSGGLRNGLDAARALALGADLAGMALPWLRAAHTDGSEGARMFGGHCLRALRTAMMLTGARTVADLRHVPRIYGSRLERWLNA